MRGTLHVTRHIKGRKGEPVPPGEDLQTAPDWLSEEQVASWNYVIEHAPRGIIKMIDRGALLVWVEAEARFRVAVMMQAKLDAGSKLPLLSKGKNDQVVISPYIGIASRAAAIMLKAGSELGFSPVSRPRLGQADKNDEPDEESAWSRLKVIEGGKKQG